MFVYCVLVYYEESNNGFSTSKNKKDEDCKGD